MTMRSNRTIARCCGGPADGRELEPWDESEPHDWPDWILMVSSTEGMMHRYDLKSHRPISRGRKQIYRYEYSGLVPAGLDKGSDE